MGVVIRKDELAFHEERGYWISRAVGRQIGADEVSVDIVHVLPGGDWQPESSADEENTVVVFAGSGTCGVGLEARPVSRGSAAYAPTGRVLRLAAEASELVCYVWRTRLPSAHTSAARPRLFSSLGNAETQLRGFRGTGQVASVDRPATMNFIFWPGTGCARLCLHCGVMQVGETFNVHLHQNSEEAFFAFEGRGQIYLKDRWVDVEPGDGVYASPNVLHGARNWHTGTGAGSFVACGGPTPFDPFLYESAGVSAQVR